MLIKYLPKPIRKLAEQRCAEFCKNYNCANLFGEKSIGELGNAFVFDATYEKREFWSLISSGDFTPYYAMYGLPKKWAIKCLPEWLDRKGKVINNDWYRCVKSIKDQLFGDDCSEYYHSNSIIDSVKKEGYTVITLSDWIAANPEKKEEKVDLPEKWAIKCLPEFLEKESWYELVKTIGEGFDGKSVNNFYHKDIGVFHCLKDEYTEITLSDWIAANPEKKEDAELNKIYNLEGFVKLENKECVIPEELNKMKSPQFDPINKPKHYNSHPSGIECIEITQHHNYCIGNSIKYLWRQGLKDGESNIKDLMKARKCIDLEIERIKKFENSGK